MDKLDAYGRGQDKADAYVDALVDWSGWKIQVEWEDKFDANLPKVEKKQSLPMDYERKVR